MKILYTLTYIFIVASAISLSYWIVGNNDYDVEKQIYCEIKFNKSKATFPCTINSKLPNVAEVEI